MTKPGGRMERHKVNCTRPYDPAVSLCSLNGSSCLSS